MWRVLPPRLVYLRPLLVRFILLGGEWENGWQEFADEAHALFARREVVLVPIYAMTPPVTGRCWSWREKAPASQSQLSTLPRPRAPPVGTGTPCERRSL